jgi:ELWxxDGT repeat protein
MLNSISYQNNLFFQANDGIHGMELWRSNGTAEGTVMISDIRTGDGDAGDLGPMTTANGLLFFTGINQDGKVALWKSSYSTITKLRDFESTNFNDVLFLGSTSNRLLFLLRVGSDTELWKSDGTLTGTNRLRRFRDVELFMSTGGAVRDNILYFGLGGKVWRSDGTTTGTYDLSFIGRATQFTTSGSYVYFFGETAQYGSELFLIDEESGPSSSARIASAEEYFSADRNISGYPNPFRSTLTLRVNGDEKETFTMSVLNATGQQIYTEVSLKCNVDHELGSSWNDGLYLIQIRQDNAVTTKKVIKTMN